MAVQEQTIDEVIIYFDADRWSWCPNIFDYGCGSSGSSSICLAAAVPRSYSALNGGPSARTMLGQVTHPAPTYFDIHGVTRLSTLFLRAKYITAIDAEAVEWLLSEGKFLRVAQARVIGPSRTYRMVHVRTLYNCSGKR